MESTLDALQQLDLPTTTALVLVVAALALVVVEPVAGRRAYRAFLAELADDPDRQGAVRVRFYRRWTRQGWALGGAAVALVVALPGVGVADLGLRLPRLDGLGLAQSELGAILVGGLVGLGIVTGMLVAVARTGRTPGTPPIVGRVAPMLPRTAPERRAWAGLASSAGVTEELTYRGLVLVALAVVLPGAQPGVVIAAAAVLFGLAHTYQGPVGVLATSVVGGAFAGLYLTTGSLLLPMVLHVLVDLRALVPTPVVDKAAAR